MAYCTFNCDGLTGGTSRDLDSHLIADITNKDRAICAVSGTFLYFTYDISGTAAENIVDHPYVVRPEDYSTAGNWEEQVTATISDTAYGSGWDGVTNESPSKNAVYDEMELRTKAAAVITDNKLIRGDGGSRGVQESTVVVDDSGRMTNPSQPAFCALITSVVLNVTGDGTTYALTGAIWTERFDQGNNLSNGTFTAPVTGNFSLGGAIDITGLDGNTVQVTIVTSNKTYYVISCDPVKIQSNNQPILSFSLPAIDMDINDTAHLTVRVVNGTKITDVGINTCFSGSLIC